MRLAITALLTSFTLLTSPLTAQICQVPANNTISYTGTNCSTGNGLPCAPGQPVTMTWGGPVQACDTFQWNFGDGTTASGSATQTHTFAAGGRYRVELKITNSGGSNMSRLFLDVDHERFWWSSPTHELIVTEGDVAYVEVRRWVGTQTATIDYYTRDGFDPYRIAAAGRDYVTTSGTLTFQPGELVKTIAVPTIENSTYDGGAWDPTFPSLTGMIRTCFLNLSTPSIGTIGPFPAAPTTRDPSTVLKISEDDPIPAVAFSSGTYTVSESAGSATMTVLRSGNLNGDLPVNWLVVAPAPPNTIFSQGTLVILSGQTSGTFTFNFPNDTIVTPDRTYRLIIRCDCGGNDSRASLIITEDDIRPTIPLRIEDKPIVEGLGLTNATTTVSLARPHTAPVDVRVQSAPGTATADDFVPVDRIVRIEAGQISASVPFTVIGDALPEPEEAFTLTTTLQCCTAEIVIEKGTATVFIANDDGLPALRIEDKPIVEGLGLTSATTTVSLSKPHTAPVDVRVQSAPGTATADDFVAVDRVVRIEAGQTSASVPFTVVGDALPEPEEAFTLTATLQCCTADIVIEKGTATVFIANDDPPVGEGMTLTASPRTLFVPQGSIGLITVGLIPAPSTPVAVTVHSSNPNVVDVPITASLAGGSATLNVLAKTKGKATLTLTPSEPGVTSQAIEVEVGERVIVTPSTGMTTGGTSVSIIAAGLEQPCEVRFGNVNTSQVTVLSPTSLMTVAPAVPAGVVDLRVTCGGARFMIPSGFRFSELRRRPTR